MKPTKEEKAIMQKCKLVPNGIPVTLEDINEMFPEDEI